VVFVALLSFLAVSAFAASSTYVGLGLTSDGVLNVNKVIPTVPGIVRIQGYSRLPFGYPSTVTGGFSVADNLRSRYIGFIMAKNGMVSSGGTIFSVDVVKNVTTSAPSPVFFAAMDITGKGDTLKGIGLDSNFRFSFYTVPLATLIATKVGGTFLNSNIAVPGQGVRMGVLAPGDSTWYQVTPAFNSSAAQKVLVIDPTTGKTTGTLPIISNGSQIVSIHKDSKKSRFLAIGAGKDNGSWFLGNLKFSSTASLSVMYPIPINMGLLYTSFNMVSRVMMIESKTQDNGFTVLSINVDTGAMSSFASNNNVPGSPMPWLGSIVEVRI